MAGGSSYNPVPTVAPTTAAPSDTLNVRSNPTQFGSQVAGAVQQGAQQLGQVAQQGAGEVLKWQGMLNETMSVDADTQYQQAVGDINSKYKSLEGLQAVGAHDKAVKDIADAREKIKATLPNPAAQRAFDLLSVRTMGYATREVGDYAATQLKQAHVGAANASMNNHIQSMSDPAVAMDPERSRDALQNIRFDAELQLQSKGNMPDGPITRDADGNVVFPDTPEGKGQQAQYQNFINQALGEAKFNQYKTIATDPAIGNPEKAYQMLSQDKDVPPEARARIVSFLAAPLKNESARDTADSVIAGANQDYNTFIGNSPEGKGDIRAAVSTQEYRGKGQSRDSIDGAIGNHQITQGTFDKYAKPGENIRNPADNDAVYNRIMDDYTTRPGWGPDRVAVAYFSGPDNVSAPGSLLPYKHNTHDGNGKYVSSYVTDINTRLNTGEKNTQTANSFMSQADYLRQNYGALVQKARDVEAAKPNSDATTIDAAASRTEQKLNDIIRTQELSDRADFDTMRQYVDGQSLNGQPITGLDQLENAPKEIRDKWHTMEGVNPYAAEGIRKIIDANNKGHPATYGSNSYQHLMDILSPDSDPKHVKDATELANQVGPHANSPLTNTGYSALLDEMKFRDKDAGSRAFADQEYNFFKETYKTANPTMITNGHSATFDKKYQDQIPIVLQLIAAGRREGKSASQLFSPTLGGKPNPDYVGNHIQYPTPDEVSKERLRNNRTVQSVQANRMADLAKHPEQIKTVEELQSLIKAKLIKPDKETLANIIKSNKNLQKYIKQQEPQVPLGIE